LIAAEVTLGWKWAAIGIGVGGLVLLDFAMFLATGSWNPKKIVLGKDGPTSTSKLQWFLWLVVVFFAYVTLWVIRARQGNFGALPDIPTNLMVVLGFSTVTTAAAQGIHIANDRKQSAAAAASPPSQPPPPTPPATPAPTGQPGGALLDDSGLIDISKTQMIAFTFVAIGVFLATLFHQLAVNPVTTTLPDIDRSLLVLMGISQGGYLGKKLVSG
jgi:hypothetical protein